MMSGVTVGRQMHAQSDQQVPAGLRAIRVAQDASF